MSLRSPSYNGRPIASIDALARALGIEVDRLSNLQANSDRLYSKAIPVRRPGKKVRYTFDTKPPLKELHGRILDRIFSHIDWPDYLMGGIKGRSYIGDARLHGWSRWVCGQDISSFYPSITTEKVSRIFIDVFKFPPRVAEFMAKICTKDGVVPQGAKTSSCLANLALYRTEPLLAAEARDSGLRYSRFVDDSQLSSRSAVRPSAITKFLSKMRSVFIRHGFKPNRDKQYFASPSRAMRVHGLNVNGEVSAPKEGLINPRCRSRS